MAEADSRRAQLEKCIKQARRVLTVHYKYLNGNETRTRVLVIDDVLTALGWGVKDPARVWLEHRVNGNKMDYILRSSSDEALAIVEAKALGSGPKDTDRRQASGYATEIGARYAVLTNGGRWEAWEMAPRTPRKDSVLVEVHLATGEIADIAVKLERLHRDVLDE